MNILAIDADPAVAARMQCDMHVSKMVTETAQILCTAAYLMRYDGAPYKPYRTDNDLFTNWVMRSRDNWDWLVTHGFALLKEHWNRKGSSHKAMIALCWARTLEPYEHEWEFEGLTPFADGTWPKEEFDEDPTVESMVQVYRAYYIRKEVVWAARATERALELVERGRADVSRGRRPIMQWSDPSSRPGWMPLETPDWKPTAQQVEAARPAVQPA